MKAFSAWQLPGGAALLIVACLLVSVIAVVAGSSQSTSAAGDCTVDPTIDSEESAFLQLINDYRGQNGLGPLALSYTLSRASAWKSVDMAVNNYVAHDDLTRTWTQRLQDCGYTYNAWLGENIVVSGPGTAQWSFDQWKGSAPHNANMLGANYTAIGIGRYYDPTSTWGWYWTVDFGSYSDGWPAGTPVATPTDTPAPPAPTSTPVPPTPTVTSASPTPAGDTTAPTVQVTSPTSGGTYSGKVNISAGATDNGRVARVDFYVDGALYKSDSRSPYAVSWSTRYATPGQHTLTARAIDGAGNTATDSVTITTK